jgi:hypothetical protein
MIALRQAHPALWASGDFQTIYGESGKYPLILRRSLSGETLFFSLNPAYDPVSVRFSQPFNGETSMEIQSLYGIQQGLTVESDGLRISLPGISGVCIVWMENSRHWKEGISKCQIPIILSKTTISGWC